MDTQSVSIYLGAHGGDKILAVAARAVLLGHPYFLFNGRLVPSADVPDDYQRCPYVGTWFLRDLERYYQDEADNRLSATSSAIEARGSK